MDSTGRKPDSDTEALRFLREIMRIHNNGRHVSLGAHEFTLLHHETDEPNSRLHTEETDDGAGIPSLSMIRDGKVTSWLSPDGLCAPEVFTG